MNAMSSYLPVRCLLWLSMLAALPLQAGNEEGLNRKIKLPKSKGTVYELLEKLAGHSGYLFIYDSGAIGN